MKKESNRTEIRLSLHCSVSLSDIVTGARGLVSDRKVKNIDFFGIFSIFAFVGLGYTSYIYNNIKSL